MRTWLPPRAGVTTVVDAGGSGWRNFEDFKQRIIDRSATRVLAMLNIVGHGMRGGKFEQDANDMNAAPTADMARRYPGVIVGIKTAHYSGPGWTPVERAVEAAASAADVAQVGVELVPTAGVLVVAGVPVDRDTGRVVRVDPTR